MFLKQQPACCCTQPSIHDIHDRVHHQLEMGMSDPNVRSNTAVNTHGNGAQASLPMHDALQCRISRREGFSHLSLKCDCWHEANSNAEQLLWRHLLLVELRRVLPLSMPRQIDGDATQVN